MGVANEELVAVVTGAGNGIGQITADDLVERGYKVVYADLDAAAAEKAAADAAARGGVTYGAHIDVTDTESVNALVAAVIEKFGQLDILINNAGVPARNITSEMTDDEWRFMMSVNLDGAFKCARAAYPHLVKSQRASITNVSSASGVVAMDHRLAYVTSKTGINGMTRGLATEWGRDGIRVNSVAPGYVRTTGFERRMLSSAEGEAVVANLVSEVPLGRVCRPEEIAGAIAFLSSSDASYITGHTLVVDGGLTISARG